MRILRRDIIVESVRHCTHERDIFSCVAKHFINHETRRRFAVRAGDADYCHVACWIIIFVRGGERLDCVIRPRHKVSQFRQIFHAFNYTSEFTRFFMNLADSEKLRQFPDCKPKKSSQKNARKFRSRIPGAKK